MGKKIKVWFTDFWLNFDKENNIFMDLLRERYEVELDEKNPDFLFFSLFGMNHIFYKCTRIFFSGENMPADMNRCDYSFSFEMPNGNPRKYRLPHYYQFGRPESLLEKPDPRELLKEKTKFCNFIFSNPSCKKRNEFFHKLSKYKKVDSAGRFLNNMDQPLGMRVEDKWEFMKPYKFSICFENEEANYYTTEKPFEAMKLNNIPIYWGNPKVEIDFNPKAILNWYDYGSDEALIQKIIELDQDDEKYIEFMSQPWFADNQINEYVKRENILAHIDKIINDKIEPVAAKSGIFSSNPIVRTATLLSEKIKFFRLRVYMRTKFWSWEKAKMKLQKIRKNQKW
jgi:hypothetical protein